jgi:hypothetical protein
MADADACLPLVWADEDFDETVTAWARDPGSMTLSYGRRARWPRSTALGSRHRTFVPVSCRKRSAKPGAGSQRLG